MKINRLDVFHALTLGPLYFVVGSFLIFSIIDLVSRPVTIITADLKSNVVMQGDPIDLTYVVNRNRSCTVRVSRVLSDPSNGMIYEINESEKTIAPEERVTVHVNQTVPRYIEPGDYVYYTRAQFVCNPYHRIFGPLAVEGRKFPITVTLKP
jgi:hypothetical protein